MASALASWDRPFQLWHYSVSYSRLLFRSVGDGLSGRVDVLFSNVEAMHVENAYEQLEIELRPDWNPSGFRNLSGMPGQWFSLNSAVGFVRATHCEWHEDEGNAMSPSRFGPFRRTD